MKRSNIVLYDSGLCAERKPDAKDVVWFIENIPSHGVALDCGTGQGYYLSSLACERIGLDISAGELSKAKTVDGRIQLIRSDVENLPFEARSIDCVLAFGLIHHLPNQEKGLDEMCRVLKRGGYFFIVYSNLDGLGPVYLLWRITMMGYDLRGRFAKGTYPKLRSLEYYLKQKGFPIDVRTEHSFLLGLSSLLDVCVSYVPFGIARAFIGSFRRILLGADQHISKLLPYRRWLSIKIIAKLHNWSLELHSM